MFTRTEAVDFAFINGLRGANFVCFTKEKLVVYYWEGRSTDLTYGSGPDDLEFTGRLSDVLRRRGYGWFVSAKTDGVWFWYFDDSGDRVPHILQ